MMFPLGQRYPGIMTMITGALLLLMGMSKPCEYRLSHGAMVDLTMGLTQLSRPFWR